MSDIYEINTEINEIIDYYNFYTKKISFKGKYEGKLCKFTYNIDTKLYKSNKNDRILQIEKNDIVKGFAILGGIDVNTKEKEYIFQMQPLIVLNNSKTVITNFIKWNLKPPTNYFIKPYNIFLNLAEYNKSNELKRIKKEKDNLKKEKDKLEKEKLEKDNKKFKKDDNSDEDSDNIDEKKSKKDDVKTMYELEIIEKNLIDKINNIEDDSEKLTVNYINERVVEYIVNFNTNALNLSEQLDVKTKDLASFFKEWYEKRLIRQIQLFNITNDEIKNVNINPLVFYKYLFKSPWYIYSIDERKSNTIQDITFNGNKPTYSEKVCSNIARKLYKLTNRSTCAHISKVTKNFSEYKEVLEKDWGIIKRIIKDRKGESIVYLYFKNSYDIEKYLSDYIDKLIVKTARNFRDPLENNENTGENNSGENNNGENNKPKIKFGSSHYIKDIDFSKDNLIEEQKIAVKFCVNAGIIILTGGGGTGKSTTCKKIYEVLKENGKIVVGTAFTGVAAANLSDILGPDVMCGTMDYLMEIANIVPRFDKLFIDEGSMLTGKTLYRFVRKFTHPYDIIVVGDINQLEPIGNFHVMKELIKSKRVPIVRLIKNHRILKSIEQKKKAKEDGIELDQKDQNNESIILNNANFLVDGMRDKSKIMTFKTGEGFSVVPSGDINILKMLISSLKDNNIDESRIAILYPYNDLLEKLNKIPQEIYRKNNKSRIFNGQNFMVGDRVSYLHTKSKFKLFNGSDGIIDDITDKGCYIIMKNTKFLLYWNKQQVSSDLNVEDQLYMNEVTQSFAATVNKYQGLARDFIFIYKPLRFDINGNKMTISNINSTYTEITRARIGVIMVGDQDTINMSTSKITEPTIENLANLLMHNRRDFEDKMNLYTNPHYQSEIILDEESDDDDDYYSD